MKEAIDTLAAWFSEQDSIMEELTGIIIGMLEAAKDQLRMDNMISKKQELLKHYAQKEPVEFIQFDAFDASGDDDSIVVPDEDGDCLFYGERFELMSGGWDVRVLLTRERIEKEKTIRMLKKIIDWIETGDSLKKYFAPREDTQNNEDK